MATKRFTDAEKWKDPFFENLSNDYKIIWLYLLDDCDNAGIWSKSIKRLNFHCDTSITEEELFTTFKDRILAINDAICIIPKFLTFQYGDDWINSNSKVIVSVKKKLELRGIDPKSIPSLYSNNTPSIPYLYSMDTPKDKDKDKEEDKVKDNVQDKSKDMDLSKEQYKDKVKDIADFKNTVIEQLNY